MAKIIYGVCGEGMGHAIRSMPIIEHLKTEHEVFVFAADRSFDYLSKRFKHVSCLKGLHIKYKNNSVDRLGTIIMNIKQFFCFLKDYSRIKRKIIEFKPDLIISDYEFLSAYAALILRIPLISIDNQHITRSKILFPKRFYRGYIETKIVNRINIPTADHYVVTSFFNSERKKKSHLIPTILREAIKNIKIKERGYILVYQTSDSNKELIRILKNIKMNFVVSGFGIEKKKKILSLSNLKNQNS